MEKRLHRAQNLLVQTDQSVTEIAMACGFQSTSHFSRVYRLHFGTSPVQQRAKIG
jgi:transcriptional regulator GlxA family with amidase domain